MVGVQTMRSFFATSRCSLTLTFTATKFASTNAATSGDGYVSASSLAQAGHWGEKASMRRGRLEAVDCWRAASQVADQIMGVPMQLEGG